MWCFWRLRSTTTPIKTNNFIFNCSRISIVMLCRRCMKHSWFHFLIRSRPAQVHSMLLGAASRPSSRTRLITYSKSDCKTRKLPAAWTRATRSNYYVVSPSGDLLIIIIIIRAPTYFLISQNCTWWVFTETYNLKLHLQAGVGICADQ